jgi:hypothetical protein
MPSRNYTVTINDEGDSSMMLQFDTPDFLEGVIQGYRWLGLNPQQMIGERVKVIYT